MFRGVVFGCALYVLAATCFFAAIGIYTIIGWFS